MRNFKKLGIDTRGRVSGKVKTICPWCDSTRGNKGDKSLSVNLDNGMYLCHHCGQKGCVPDEAEQRMREQRRATAKAKPMHYRRPTFHPESCTLSEKVERYLVEQRCLSQAAIKELRIGEADEWMPASGKKEHCICFNYFENGELVNTKYRTAKKEFKMVTDAELIPYHIDGIAHTPTCIITEGEMDAASFVTAGRNDVVSVPSGANKNLTWLDRFVPTHFEDKKLIYIAVDSDSKGLMLQQELVRRLGSERCRIVHFGPECKDANEHLVRYGVESLLICLEQAEEIPLEGAFTAEDLHEEFKMLFENGLKQGAESGWEEFDMLCTFELGRLMVVTGVPGDGKSEWVDELCLRLCLRHDWKIGFFSPENMPISYHLRKLAEKLNGVSFSQATGASLFMYEQTEQFLAANVTHLLPGDEDYSLETILEKGRQLVARRGIRILVIDPMNSLNMNLRDGETELMYYRRALNSFRRFALQNHCLLILVAHPRKMNRDALTGRKRRVEMNDIFGSSDFANKPDYCLTVHRHEESNLVTIYIDKVKFKHLGTRGSANFVYNMVNGRYSSCLIDEQKQPYNTQFDSNSWIDLRFS